MLSRRFSARINRLLSSIRRSPFLAKTTSKENVNRRQTIFDYYFPKSRFMNVLILRHIHHSNYSSNAKQIEFFLTKRTMHIFSSWLLAHVHAFGFIYNHKRCKFTFKNIHCTFSEDHLKLVFDCGLWVVDGTE